MVLVQSQGVDLLVLGIVAYSAIGALNPKSPTFSEANQRDVRKRPAGACTIPICHLLHKPVCVKLICGKVVVICRGGFWILPQNIRYRSGR